MTTRDPKNERRSREGIEPWSVAERIAGATAGRLAWLCERYPSVGVADLRQEALLAILLESRARGGDVSPGLAKTVARRAALTAIDRQRPTWGSRDVVLTLQPDDAPSVDAAEGGDLAIDLREAVAALPDESRHAIRRKAAGWSNPEIAEADGVKTSAVVGRLNRAHRLLRDRLSAYAVATYQAKGQVDEAIDPEADARAFDAWKGGGHASRDALAAKLGLTRDALLRAFARHRGRLRLARRRPDPPRD